MKGLNPTGLSSLAVPWRPLSKRLLYPNLDLGAPPVQPYAKLRSIVQISCTFHVAWLLPQSHILLHVFRHWQSSIFIPYRDPLQIFFGLCELGRPYGLKLAGPPTGPVGLSQTPAP